jgi:hypothetical protein
MESIIIKKEWSELSVNFSNIDVSLEQYFQSFKGMLVSLGWHETTINDFIIEWAEELNELKDTK